MMYDCFCRVILIEGLILELIFGDQIRSLVVYVIVIIKEYIIYLGGDWGKCDKMDGESRGQR